MLGSGFNCKVVVVVTVCADDTLMANFHLAGLAEHGAFLGMGSAGEGLSLVRDALTSRVPQVRQRNHFVGLKFTPAAMYCNTEMADKLGTFGAV